MAESVHDELIFPLSFSQCLRECSLFIHLWTEMRPHTLGCAPLPLHYQPLRDSPNSKKGRIHHRFWDSFQCPSTGLGKKESWIYGQRRVHPPQPLAYGKHTKQPQCNSTKVCTTQDRMHYFTFVTRVRLWDREQHHYPFHLQVNLSRPSLPCPRFMAHMKTSSDSHQLPWNFTSEPRTLFPGALNTESPISLRDIQTLSACSSHRYPAGQFGCLQFKPSSKSQPKSPPANKAPSGEDEGRLCCTQTNSPPGTNQWNTDEDLDVDRVHTNCVGFWSDAHLGDRGAEEVAVGSESISPLPHTSSRYGEKALSVTSHGCEFSHERNSNEAGTRDRPPTSRAGSSTDLSQLRYSSLSWSSRDSAVSELQAGSTAQSDRTHLWNASPLTTSGLYHSLVNLDQGTCGCGNTGSPRHISSSVAGESPMERTPSYVEIWHGRLLSHWPVLPPISPQAGSLEARSCGNDGEVTLSDRNVRAYEELEGGIPYMSSSLSQHTLGDSTGLESDSGSRVPPQPGSSPEQKAGPSQRNNRNEEGLSNHSMMIDWSQEVTSSSSLILSLPVASNKSSPPVMLKPQTAAFPENSHQPEVTPSPNEGSPSLTVGTPSRLKPELYPAPSHHSARTTSISGRSGPSKDLPRLQRVWPRQEPKAKGLDAIGKLRPVGFSGTTGSEDPKVSGLEEVNFLEKYCIFSREDLALYKEKFREVDNNIDGYLSCTELVTALKEMVPLAALTDSEESYIYRILESLDYHVADGLTDLRLFTVMVSLARKITALNGFTRSLIGSMDLKALDLNVYKAKQLFLCNLEAGSNMMTVEQFLLELKAGGISQLHEEKVRQELQHTRNLDLLDFLTYLPLFVLIHNLVVSNPLDSSATL
ncbi:uncharacterized protein [Narcine bancroftii]|uniref:uncharacterized protein isoform X2 n=1 Tax=Narcine bancroftii TaxID=1343680 RepID=UPI0038317196